MTYKSLSKFINLGRIQALAITCALPVSHHFASGDLCHSEAYRLHTEFPMAKKLSPLHWPKLESLNLSSQGHAVGWPCGDKPAISRSCRRLKPAGQRRSAGMWQDAPSVATITSPTTVASCKNRHCPKCQGPAARDWMEARAEDLLPVEYFHVVAEAQIAYCKKAVYGLLFKASAETVADPKRLGVNVGLTSVLGLRDDPPSAHPYDRARRRLIARRQSMGRLQARVLLARAGVVETFRRLFLDGLMAAWMVPGAFAADINPNGWCIPNRPSAGPKPCLPISAVTPIEWRSQTSLVSADATWWRSAGRTTAPGRRSSEGHGPGHVGVHPTFPTHVL